MSSISARSIELAKIGLFLRLNLLRNCNDYFPKHIYILKLSNFVSSILFTLFSIMRFSTAHNPIQFLTYFLLYSVFACLWLHESFS